MTESLPGVEPIDLPDGPMTALSILDLAFIRRGATPAEALRDSLDLAQHGRLIGWQL